MRKGLVLLLLMLLIGCSNDNTSWEEITELATQTATVAPIPADEPPTITPEPTPAIDFVELYGEGKWVVGRVIDGDSIRVYEDTPENDSVETLIISVALAGINAPEIHKCAGKQSWEALRLLIAGKHVEIEFDDYYPEGGIPLYGYIYLNGMDVNLWMIMQGWATALEGGYNRVDIYPLYQGLGGYNSICVEGSPPPDPTVAVSHCIWKLFDSCWEMEQEGCAPAYMTDTWYEEEHDHNGDLVACGKGDY